MELTNVPLFGIMRRRMAWLNQRQEVLARNIANADTPEFRARDLKAFDAKKEIRERRENFNVNVTQTNNLHIKGRNAGASKSFKEAPVRSPYETAPAGNSVILEEQMIKVNENGVNHQLVSGLYRKHLRMFRQVTRGGGSGG